jgi:hypothetical protein
VEQILADVQPSERCQCPKPKVISLLERVLGRRTG